jgi:hypothetical protein
MSTYLTTGTRGRVHLVPDVASDTFCLIAATQTLTNKTLTSPVINGASGVGVISTSVTGVNTATTRAIVGAMTTPATFSSGNLVGARGSLTMGAAATGGYLYGVQGKAITGAFAFSGTVLAGVYGQLDVTGGTITSGNVAAVQANLYGYTTGTSTVLTGLYVEHAGGGVINSLARFFGKSTYVFDIETNVHNQVSLTGTAAATTSKGWLKILVDGTARYIPLTDSVS